MNATPLAIVFDRRVQELFDQFCSLLGVRIALFNTSGDEVVVGLSKPSCRFCRIIASLMSSI